MLVFSSPETLIPQNSHVIVRLLPKLNNEPLNVEPQTHIKPQKPLPDPVRHLVKEEPQAKPKRYCFLTPIQVVSVLFLCKEHRKIKSSTGVGLVRLDFVQEYRI